MATLGVPNMLSKGEKVFTFELTTSLTKGKGRNGSEMEEEEKAQCVMDISSSTSSLYVHPIFFTPSISIIFHDVEKVSQKYQMLVGSVWEVDSFRRSRNRKSVVIFTHHHGF